MFSTELQYYYVSDGVETSLDLHLYLKLEHPILAVSQLLEDPANRALLHDFLFPVTAKT